MPQSFGPTTDEIEHYAVWGATFLIAFFVVIWVYVPMLRNIYRGAGPIWTTVVLVAAVALVIITYWLYQIYRPVLPWDDEE